MSPPAADELVERARLGDEQARAALVERHYAAVWSLARKLTRDDATASDVAQETFLRAFARLDQYDGQHRFASWLFKIATNHVRDLFRRHGPSAWEGPEPQVPPAHAAIERDEDVARVRKALDELAPGTRAAMVLHLQEGMSIPEIAFALEQSEDAVRNRIYRGLQDLRSRLAEKES